MTTYDHVLASTRSTVEGPHHTVRHQQGANLVQLKQDIVAKEKEIQPMVQKDPRGMPAMSVLGSCFLLRVIFMDKSVTKVNGND